MMCKMGDVCLVKNVRNDNKFEWLVYMHCEGVREEENILSTSIEWSGEL